MEAFVNSDNKNILYFDYSFYKKIKNDGSLYDFENSEALSQAIKMWLASKKNEKIRSVGGGIIYPYLGKIMDFEVASKMQFDIIQGLKYDFSPSLTPVEVTVVPNNDRERWEIGIVAYNSVLGVGVNTNVVISNKVSNLN